MKTSFYIFGVIAFLGNACAPVEAKPAKKTSTKKTTAKKAVTKKPAQNASSALKRKAGYIVGRATNAQGKPLANVRIRVYGMTDAGRKGSIHTKTNAAGIYSLRLPSGNYSVATALYDVVFNGKPYALPLHPKDGEAEDFDSRQGAVENFVLKVSGLTSPRRDPEQERSYYGGWLRVSGGQLENGSFLGGYEYRFPEGSSIELTFVPQGKLIDGSVGKTLTMRKAAVGVPRFLNIPIGKYRVSAKLIESNGNVQTLRAAAPVKNETPTFDKFAATATIFFRPAGDVALMTPGVEQADIYLQP